MINNKTYISVDVECTGYVPGKFSMISLGAVAVNRNGDLLDKFAVNIHELIGSERDPDTMEFWKKNSEAYKATLEDRKRPEVAMKEFVDWFTNFTNPVFVFMPAKFDAMFVYWYLQTFVPEMNYLSSPDAIDVKTLAMVAMKKDTPELARKRDWPNNWKNKKIRHNHVAVDDAEEQAEQFIKILNYILGSSA